MKTDLMSLLGLFALFLVLVTVGIEAQSYKEYFATQIEVTGQGPAAASPVMANLSNAAGSDMRKQPLPQISKMDRDADAVAATEDAISSGRHGSCPACKEQCPDMSKYIRRDSIPCWNCSL
jgi:hypothetical protein